MNFRLATALTASLVAIAASATAAELPRGVQSGVNVDRFTLNNRQAMNWAARGILGAKKGVLAEVFDVSNKKVLSAMHQVVRANVRVRAHTDPENIANAPIQSLIRAGADFRPSGGVAIEHGEVGPKVHAKALFFKGPGKNINALFSTAGFLQKHMHALDATALVSDEAAAAGHAYVSRSFHNDIPGMRETADKARSLGILVNDKAAGIDHLSEGMVDVTRGAERELIAGIKVIESAEFAKQLSETARTAKVILITRVSKMSPEAKAALSSNVILVDDPDKELHGNMMVADGEVALFGSAHASHRALGEGTKRTAHEMGYVTKDANATKQIREALLALAERTGH